MSRIVLIRPGLTDFDAEGRIKGTLDIPLNETGRCQASDAAEQLSGLGMDVIYCSPSQSAAETARLVGQQLHLRVKSLKQLHNLNHGLWQGQRIDELRSRQKKVYRQWQDQPETVCPPQGEMLSTAQSRVKTTLDKLIRKHKQGTIGLVVPEPLNTLVRCYLQQSDFGDLWACECESGSWTVIDTQPAALAAR